MRFHCAESVPSRFQNTANIEVNDNNLADLSYSATGVIGSVVVENGAPIFKPMGD